MIFHASLPADDPRRVAAVLAEIWQGESFAFPPWPGAFVAMAGDARGSTVEVYPRTRPIVPGEAPGEMGRPGTDPAPGRFACFHLAVATDRTADEILAIGAREGWRALQVNRGGLFDVVELWLENAVMVEVLTAEMQASYQAGVNLDTWRRPGARNAGAASAP